MTLLRGLTDLLNSVASFLTALEVDIFVLYLSGTFFREASCMSFGVTFFNFMVSILHSFHMGRVCKTILTKEHY